MNGFFFVGGGGFKSLYDQKKAAIASGIGVDSDNNNIARAAPKKSDPEIGLGGS